MEEKIAAENIQITFSPPIMFVSSVLIHNLYAQTEKPHSNIPLADFADFIHGQI